MAKGVWYEKFVQEVFQGLVKQDAVKTIDVKHNITLTGRSKATHQIDVFWEFEIAGVRYRTCIECKDYQSSVKKSHVASFASILADIGNTTGIFATTGGYQRGAKQLATDQHIRLLVLTPTILKVLISMKIIAPEYWVTGIDHDADEAKKLLVAAGKTSLEHNIEGYPDKMDLLDSSGERKSTLGALIRTGPKETSGSFSVPAAGYYLPSEIGLIPLKAVHYNLVLHEDMRQIEVNADHAVKAILKDVLANTTEYFPAAAP